MEPVLRLGDVGDVKVLAHGHTFRWGTMAESFTFIFFAPFARIRPLPDGVVGFCSECESAHSKY